MKYQRIFTTVADFYEKMVDNGLYDESVGWLGNPCYIYERIHQVYGVSVACARKWIVKMCDEYDLSLPITYKGFKNSFPSFREYNRWSSAKYRKEHPQKVAETQKRCYEKHKEDRLARNHRYYREHREQCLEYARKNYLKNREKILKRKEEKKNEL